MFFVVVFCNLKIKLYYIPCAHAPIFKLQIPKSTFGFINHVYSELVDHEIHAFCVLSTGKVIISVCGGRFKIVVYVRLHFRH